MKGIKTCDDHNDAVVVYDNRECPLCAALEEIEKVKEAKEKEDAENNRIIDQKNDDIADLNRQINELSAEKNL